MSMSNPKLEIDFEQVFFCTKDEMFKGIDVKKVTELIGLLGTRFTEYEVHKIAWHNLFEQLPPSLEALPVEGKDAEAYRQSLLNLLSANIVGLFREQIALVMHLAILQARHGVTMDAVMPIQEPVGKFMGLAAFAIHAFIMNADLRIAIDENDNVFFVWGHEGDEKQLDASEVIDEVLRIVNENKD